MDSMECRDWYESIGSTNSSSVICTSSIGKKFCQTDIGAPLVVDNILEGIVIGGGKISKGNFPDSFGRVANVREWIRKYTKV